MMRRLYGSTTLAALLLATLAASCSKDPQKEKQLAMERGDQYVAKKQYSEAIIEYRKAVTFDPRFGAARMKLGQAYVAVNDPIAALREYIRAADILTDDVDAQLAAGTGLLAAGQYPEAKQRAMNALEKDPKNVIALRLMGNAMAGMKDL